MAHAPTLFFIKMKGCSFCDAAEPEVRKLAAANPGLVIQRKDTTKDKLPFPVPFVPAFVLVLPDGRAFMADADKLPNTKASTLAGWVRDVAHGKRTR